ncbi:MAG TPA: hypothetical protein VEI83_13525 [Acidimicrobiales bacterium]|nr:hypothetical protein [Acidimicrobiales bacterium]
MTTTTDAPAPIEPSNRVAIPRDHRGSWLPTGAMIAAKFKDLRKRRALMIALSVVTVGIPTTYFAIRLLQHAVDPHTYGPAGGYNQYVGVVVGVLYVFGFIVAATLGATAGSADLTEGMFRHHVITGRSRIALYLARIPAGLAIILPLVAIGFTVVCAVCVFAAPTTLSYQGVNVPVNLSSAGLQSWAAEHADEVICNFSVNLQNTPNGTTIAAVINSVPCGNGPGGGPRFVAPGSQAQPQASPAQISDAAKLIARQDYADYTRQFLYPSTSLMVKTGLWIELEAVIGFTVGLGLASLLGQRTVAVVLLIVLELIITPIAARARLPHLSNLQRGVVGLATTHLEPGWLPAPFGGGPSDRAQLLHESTTVAVCVIVAWIVVWTALGAWRMMTRDA